MKNIKLSDFSSWEDYYRTYQNLLAKEYYIPYLKNQKVPLNENILDIGCGNGGFVDAIRALSNSSNNLIKGIDIKAFSSWDSSNTSYNVHNILEDDNKDYEKKYNLVILRDVIEHIHKKDKDRFMRRAMSFLKSDGKMLVTFPPYRSPFGLHQQAIMKSFLKYIPFLSLLPKSILKKLVYRFENENIWIEIEGIINSGMTISKFKKISKKAGFSIHKERYFSIRPSHGIRYGIKTSRSLFGYFPLVREFLVLGTCYILKIKNNNPSN